jgi:hypothetical protein
MIGFVAEGHRGSIRPGIVGRGHGVSALAGKQPNRRR